MVSIRNWGDKRQTKEDAWKVVEKAILRKIKGGNKVDKETKSQCMLCGVEYPTGVVYATEQGRHSRGRHHLFPRRFEKRGMSQEELAKKLDVETRDLGFVHLCFECHEELLHNPVLTAKTLDKLSHLMRGKSFADRVIILSRIIEMGIREAKLEKVNQ